MANDSAGVRIMFGMYTGLTVGEVSRLPDGEKYLLSLLDNRSVGRPLKDAIKEFYQFTETHSNR